MSESADERKGPAVDPRILRRLWPFLRPHQRWVWLGFSCLMLGLGCRLAGPFLVKIAIDDHLAAGEPDGYGWIVGAFLALLAGLLLWLVAIMSIFIFLVQIRSKSSSDLRTLGMLLNKPT